MQQNEERKDLFYESKGESTNNAKLTFITLFFVIVANSVIMSVSELF